LKTGKLGLVNVTCEVIDKQPNYAQGTVDFTLLDTRFISISLPYQIAAAADDIPIWDDATPQLRAQYMFISPGS
jgi:hypothetical protein